MTDKERLELINENWGNYPTETTKGMTALCLDFEWLLEQAEKAQRYEKALERISVTTMSMGYTSVGHMASGLRKIAREAIEK